jgi:hypothetical protein
MTILLGEPLYITNHPLVKGGSGSGNFGHSGRTGVRGGSGGGGMVGGGGTSISRIKNARADFASVAQKVYDEWEQDEEGYDEELGGGGICQDIAAGISDKLNDMGYEATTVSAQTGEQHVWAIAKTDEGVVEVDISPYTYETGGGYSWRKIDNVVFDANDVIVNVIDADPEAFSEYTEE